MANEKAKKGVRLSGGTSLSLVISLVFIVIVFTIISPNHVFLTIKNFSNILVNSSITSIMAAGSMVAMLLGSMDISQYAVATLASVTAAIMLQNGSSFVVALLALIFVSAICGLVNGLLFAKFKVQGVVTTMGTMQIFRGIAYIISGAKTVMIENEAYSVVGRTYIFRMIPVAILLMIAVNLITYYVLNYSSFGRKVYAVGGNKQASYLSGISAEKIGFGAMMYSSICAGIGGFLLSSQTSAAIPSSGAGNEMSILSGIILGGISLAGGKGRVSGTILGVLVISTIKNGLTLCNVNAFVQMIVEGSILVIAVLLDLFRNGAYKRQS